MQFNEGDPMNRDEMEVVGRLREVEPVSATVSERAKMVLRAAMAADGNTTTSESDDRGRAPLRRTRRRLVLTGVASVAAVAALIVSGVSVFGSSSPTTTSTISSATNSVSSATHPLSASKQLYLMAAVSVSAPVVEGRYVILSETDTEIGYPGEMKRTSVVDTQTGASTTYQQAYSTAGIEVPNSTYVQSGGGDSSTVASNAASGNVASSSTTVPTRESDNAGPPTSLQSGPDASSTAAWYAALPTDPTALRAKLLDLATETTDGIAPALVPTFSDDDYIYQEADLMLWSPLVQPNLRSALYKVLAATTGYSVSTGNDPVGRSAVIMTRSYTGVSETDTTYEDPTTGAVLAQVWKNGTDVITSVYQPVTSAAAIPTDPYQN